MTRGVSRLANRRAGPRAGETPASLRSRYSAGTRSTRSSSFHTTSLVLGPVDFRDAGRDQQSGSAMRRLVLVQLDGDIEVAPDFDKGLVKQDPNGRPAGPLGLSRTRVRSIRRAAPASS